MKPKPPLEKDIQKTIIQYLRLIGGLPIRVNSGAFAGEYKGKKRFIKMNDQPGCSDTITCLPSGRFAAFEVKRPGGKATPEQLAFLAEVNRRGGIGAVVTCVEDVQAILMGVT